MINWKEGCIKEVARVYHEAYGLTNITYEKYPDRIVFFVDGFFLCQHQYFLK